ARSRWVLSPSDTTKIGLALDYAKYEIDDMVLQQIPGAFAADGVSTFPGKYNNELDAPNFLHSKQYGASLRIDQDFGGLHGVSITGYRDLKSPTVLDGDVSPNNFTLIEGQVDANYLSEELQLSNNDKSRIDWLTGAYFFRSDVDQYQIRTGTRVAG